MALWTHPTLGAFEFEDLGWFAEIKLPGFAQFDLDAPPDYDRTVIELTFEADEPDEFPSNEMANVASRIVDHHQRLIADGVRLFFDDICGHGPDSGMWWHDDLDHVNEIIAHEAKRLDQLEDMFALLNGPSLFVQASGYGFDAACAIIGFESPIDFEHGVGWLTDGNRVLGTGYRSDVSPNEGNE